jgi:hypothetical protein
MWATAFAVAVTAAEAWATDCAIRGEVLELELESVSGAPVTVAPSTATLRPSYGGTITFQRAGDSLTLRPQK